jgi:uncharacterized protein
VKHSFMRWAALALCGALAACSARYADDRQVPVVTGESRPQRPIAAAPAEPERVEGGRSPRPIGMLLPLTGPYAEAADAVQNGFIGAHFRDGGDFAIRIYDTEATTEGAATAYEQALADGAELIVGPLTKGNVRAVESEGSAVPVVALNFVDGVARRDFHQLGLAPEDEAREAARSAFLEGARSAMVLVPGTPWGQRIAEAFSEEFAAFGGLVRKQGTFDEEAYDFSPAIKESFGIADSEARHHALTRIIGMRSKFEPRRRDDFDVVFIGATAEKTRLLVPQLRFHRVDGIPVYGTADVHDGMLRFHHRDGLRFCGSPIVLDESGENAELRQILDAAFHPDDLDSLRLLALGFDAYRFARLVLESDVDVGEGITGATGTLVVGADGAVRRQLSCVEISARRLVPLPGAAAP